VTRGRRAGALLLLAALLLGGTGCTAARPEGHPTPTAPPTWTPPPSDPARTLGLPGTPCDGTLGEPSPATLPRPVHAAGTTVTGGDVRLGRGTWSFSDFRIVPGIQRIGLLIQPTVHSVTGAGPASTLLAMRPHTSTAAGTIPAHFPDSNRLFLVRAAGSSVRLSGFSVVGTPQGHPYNGLRVERSTGARVTDVCVAGIPGTDSKPPGETFGIADNLTTGSVYRDVAVDGRWLSAAGLGASVSSDITVLDSRFFDNRASSGATFWEVHNATVRDVTAVDNGLAGLNFERVTGTVIIDRPTLSGNVVGDIRIASDQGSAHYVIRDPVLAPGARLTVVLPPTYYGHPERQRRSDIRLLVDGKDRTADLVRFITP